MNHLHVLKLALFQPSGRIRTRERGKKLARRDIAKIEDLERVESLESRARMCTWAKSIFEFDVTAAAVARGSLSLSLPQ